MEQSTLKIRRMTEHDIDGVLEIEKDLFTLPWSRTSFLFEVSDNSRSFAIVGVHGDAIAGYAIGWFVSDELHIGNVAVARDRQGRGLGKQLLEYMLKEASVRKVSIASLEVRSSNVRAISLYRKYGFKGVAVRRSYYTDNGEDALVMLADIKSDRSCAP
jgi:ribosomal-protein-alanine N-acetyltransferase